MKHFPLVHETPASATAVPTPGRGLSVVSITKSFDDRVVLEEASLDVAPGKVVALLGPDGAGKTVLFYSIIGLIRPDSGRIMLDGFDVTRLPTYRRARLGLGYLPQDPCIFRGLSVRENIQAVLEVYEPDPEAAARGSTGCSPTSTSNI